VRTVYLGTSSFAATVLERLAGSDHRPALVVTRPDAPRGRGRKLAPPPVAEKARELGLELIQPERLHDDDVLARIAAAEPDALAVCAYGALIREPLLSTYEILNVHPSLLPRWRGAAPISRAIMAGDPETGVMVMRMEEGLDTGPVAMAERVPIAPDATAGDLHDRLARLGADLMVRALGALERSSLVLTPQSADGVTYAHKIAKDETRIDWTRPWREVHDRLRGLSPFPGAWFELDGTRIKLLRSTRGEGTGVPGTVLDNELTVACGEGAVRILELQRAGRQAMKGDEFLRGSPVAPGTRFG
jgi:methionyl-tRNA formyltransferase